MIMYWKLIGHTLIYIGGEPNFDFDLDPSMPLAVEKSWPTKNTIQISTSLENLSKILNVGSGLGRALRASSKFSDIFFLWNVVYFWGSCVLEERILCSEDKSRPQILLLEATSGGVFVEEDKVEEDLFL